MNHKKASSEAFLLLAESEISATLKFYRLDTRT